MKSIFLESHNLNNPCSGFGQFNYHLLKAFSEMDTPGMKMTVHVNNPIKWRNTFGRKFDYKFYFPFRRYEQFQIRKSYDLWHSLNQNTKIEPKSLKTPYVLTVHDIHFAAEGHQKRMALFKEKLNRASAITYISEYAQAETHQFFDIPPIPEYVIYNGNPVTEMLNIEGFRPSFPVDKPFIYSIGNFLERKNFHVLIEMLRLLPDFNLVISGECDRPYGVKIKEMIRENKMENRVFLTGRISELGKQFCLKNCLAFCWPSLREGFGLPPIEAMRFKKPVFLADKTSLPEIGGKAAFYWKNFDPEEMKRVLLEGLNHHENNKVDHHRALLERADFFCWKKAAKQYLEVYRAVG